MHWSRRLTGGPDAVALNHCVGIIEGQSEVFPEEDLEFRHPLATPVPVHFRQRRRNIMVFRDVDVWPESSLVLTRSGNVVRESALSNYRVRRLIEEGRERRRKRISIEGPCTVIEQGSMDNHYHWHIDILPRLYSLHHPSLLSLSTITLLITDRVGEERFQTVERLIPPQVRVERVPSTSVVRTDRFIHLPYLSDDWAGYLPREYLEFFREKMNVCSDAENGGVGPRRRLFVSRADADVRRLLNEEEVTRQLARLGFEVYVPGHHTLGEQIDAFSDAEVIVGMHGAGLTNMLYSNNAKVLEIRPSNYPGLNHFRLLAAALGHEYANLDFGTIFHPYELQVPWRLKHSREVHNANVRADPKAVLETLHRMGVGPPC
jgi:hypothetical protein